MPRSGAGTYSPPSGTEAVSGEVLSSSDYNTVIDDLGNEITNSLPVSGVKPMSAALAMGGNKITGLADGTADTDALAVGQVEDMLTDPGADRLFGWDDSAAPGSNKTWFTMGTNISITGTTINVSSGTATLGDGDYGDITASGSGTVLTIDANTITLAKMATMATASFLGRNTAGTGNVEVLSAATAASLIGAPSLTANNTFTGTGMKITLSDPSADASKGPTLDLYRNSSSPAANDDIGVVRFSAKNSSNAQTTFAELQGTIIDPGASEDATITARTVIAGTLADRFHFGSGLYYSSGADQGANTINATVLYETAVSLATKYAAIGGWKTTVNAQTGTSYELVLTDAGKIVTLSNGSGITLTIPANGAVAFPVGTQISLMQIGAGQVSVAITSDTLRSTGGHVKLTGQYSRALLEKYTSTIWMLSGDIAA